MAQEKAAAYYIGLMSGTSIDGLDGVIMRISGAPQALQFETVAAGSHNWPLKLKETLHQLCLQNSEVDRLETIYRAANGVAEHEAILVKELLAQAKLEPEDIVAIGAHGQTIRHCPQLAFSAQIDNGPQLAHSTGIDAVVNFRAADIACGGQGAPLTQAFHQQVFAQEGRACLILNLGGIANLTALSKEGELLTAFDTGPANTLMDYVCRAFLHVGYDQDGSHARAGKVDTKALEQLLAHPYLQRDFPKSTGREDFNEATIDFMLHTTELSRPKTSSDSTAPAPTTTLAPTAKQRLNDILATLCEYTARSVVDAIAKVVTKYSNKMSPERDLVLCGGGALNPFLRERLTALADEKGLNLTLRSCSDFGLDAKFLEAQAFAYFAYCTVNGICLKLGASTGAHSPALLGCICPAPHGHYVRTLHQQP